jgi:ribosomal protein S18 acetylase RimI-like enzyme
VQAGGAVGDIWICDQEAAGELHRLTSAAFAGYGWLDPPSGAVSETVDDVWQDLARNHGLLYRLDGRPVAGLRFERRPDHLYVHRVAVDPAFQRRGIGRALMQWVHEYCRRAGIAEVRVGVRSQLPGNCLFYEALGYEVVGEHSHPGYTSVTWYEMRFRP